MTHQRPFIAGFVVVALLGVAGLLLARDVAALRPLLSEVEVHLGTATAVMEEGDAESAGAAISAAAEGVAVAQTRVDGPLWALARLVPRYGASARAATHAVELGDAVVHLADSAVEEALWLFEGEGAASFIGPGGAVDTDALIQASQSLEALPVEAVGRIRDRLVALPAAGLVGATAETRDQAVVRATSVVNQIESARTGARVFGTFLGSERPRTYILAVQNPGELRGTGGLISYLAELNVIDGRISVRAITGLGAFMTDQISPSSFSVGFDVDAPVERSPAFAERYDHNAGGSIIQSVNLDPDLTTVGPVLLRLYEARTDRDVDGAILVDPFALAEILGATGGPLDVPAFALAEAPTLPAQLTTDNVARTLLVDVYDAFGGLNPVRRDFDDAVTLGVLQRLTSGDWEPAALARALADAAAARRLQLYSADETEQAGFVALGVAGAMPPAAEAVDMLAVTGVNSGPNKSDAHVWHRMTAEVSLRAREGAVPWQVLRDTEVTVEVHNPLRPDDHDDYITGTNDLVPVGTSAGPRRRDALNRTWFTIWSPASTRLTALRDGINGGVLRTGTIHGHTAVDYFLETPSQSTAAFSAPHTGPLELEQVGGRYLYELLLWRQAKAIPDAWDVTVTPPEGLVVDRVEVTGGGEPSTGLGPAEPQPLDAVVRDDGSVRLTGTVTRDATLRVFLVGA